MAVLVRDVNHGPFGKFKIFLSERPVLGPIPSQAAFPDTARLLPVMGPAPPRTTAYTVLAEDGCRHSLIFTGPSRLGYAWGPVGAMPAGLLT